MCVAAQARDRAQQLLAKGGRGLHHGFTRLRARLFPRRVGLPDGRLREAQNPEIFGEQRGVVDAIDSSSCGGRTVVPASMACAWPRWWIWCSNRCASRRFIGSLSILWVRGTATMCSSRLSSSASDWHSASARGRARVAPRSARHSARTAAFRGRRTSGNRGGVRRRAGCAAWRRGSTRPPSGCGSASP